MDNNTSKDNQNNSKLSNSIVDVKVSSLVKDTADPLYRTPIFLSYATPYNELQTIFLDRIISELRNVLLFPRTLGVSELEAKPPLTVIRQMILTSFGMLAVAFRRVLVIDAISRPGTSREKEYKNVWLTSPYLQIEPSMAYLQGLPLMILVEDGVVTDGVFGGILEQGAAPLTIPVFTLQSIDTINQFFSSVNWKSVFFEWISQVRTYYDSFTTKVIQGTSFGTVS